MMRRTVSLAFSLIALASPLAAQSHPDFSGKWVLDPKSVEGPMAPTALTVTATQDAKTLKTETAATTQYGEQKSTVTVNLDGTPSKNTVDTPNGPIELSSIAKWEGTTLVLNTTATINGGQLQQTDHWSLEADGKTLHLQREVAFGGQNFTMKMVLAKQ
jgi:hypothetical protein